MTEKARNAYDVEEALLKQSLIPANASIARIVRYMEFQL